ncbi:hypothetical protein D3C71_1472680 [compost metagenome]
MPFWHDLHPDGGRADGMVRRACIECRNSAPLVAAVVVANLPRLYRLAGAVTFTGAILLAIGVVVSLWRISRGSCLPLVMLINSSEFAQTVVTVGISMVFHIPIRSGNCQTEHCQTTRCARRLRRPLRP